MNKINFKDPFLYVRVGLGLVFLAIGLSAFFSGEEVSDLISNSFVSHIFPFSVGTLTFLVGIHDTLMCLLIIFLRKYQKYLFAWAMIWLLIVMTVMATPLDTVEHLGYFSVAFALWLQSSPQSATTTL